MTTTTRYLDLLTFLIGGELEINRLGYGAMRITGKGIWGPPADREEALRTLRRLPELGVDFIDTANSYGPNVSEELIKEALHPYAKVTVATKAGLTRSGPDVWAPKGDPTYLVNEAYASRDRLGVEQIALWQLHRIDPGVPRDEQFGAVRQLLTDGVIVHAGLSEVSVDEIKAAQKFLRRRRRCRSGGLQLRRPAAARTCSPHHGEANGESASSVVSLSEQRRRARGDDGGVKLVDGDRQGPRLQTRAARSPSGMAAPAQPEVTSSRSSARPRSRTWRSRS